MNLYTFGDSHVLSYGNNSTKNLNFNILENHISASSITGLNNHKSALQTGQKIKNIISTINKNEKNILLFQFG
jgi:hypothetical protein